MDEVQDLVGWLSKRITELQRDEASIRGEPGRPSNREWTEKLEGVRAKIKDLRDLRSRVATRDYPSIDRARTMRVDAEDAER